MRMDEFEQELKVAVIRNTEKKVFNLDIRIDVDDR